MHSSEQNDELYNFLLIDKTLELVKQSPLLFNAGKSNPRFDAVFQSDLVHSELRMLTYLLSLWTTS